MSGREEQRRQRKRQQRKRIVIFSVVVLMVAASIAIAARILVGDEKKTAATDFPVSQPVMAVQRQISKTENDIDAQAEPTDGQGKATIVVDAGHGGFDVGTRGNQTGIYEMDINLAIAKELEQQLIQKGFTVIMTREDQDAVGETKEEDMQKRSDIIAGKEVDLMVSIHQNWFQGQDASGPQVFYMPGSTKGGILAKKIQDTLVAELEVQQPRAEKAEDFRLLKAGSAPAVIVECGFLSNPQDEENLSDPQYQKRVAQAVAQGVEAYWKEMGM